jgi:hypothetical protein
VAAVCVLNLASAAARVPGNHACLQPLRGAHVAAPTQPPRECLGTTMTAVIAEFDLRLALRRLRSRGGLVRNTPTVSKTLLLQKSAAGKPGRARGERDGRR